MEEEEEQQFGGGCGGVEAGRGTREALCSAQGNHALSLLHPKPSPQPTDFPILEIRRGPAAGNRVRRRWFCLSYRAAAWRENAF